MTPGSVIAGCTMGEIYDHPSFARLWAAAAAECANKSLSPAAPQREFYRALEASGYARFFRCGEGDELHGFACVLLAPSGHNGQWYATVESLFIEKQSRAGGAGDRMLDAVSGNARAAGCEGMFISAHVGTALAKLCFLYADRYELTNFIFLEKFS